MTNESKINRCNSAAGRGFLWRMAAALTLALFMCEVCTPVLGGAAALAASLSDLSVRAPLKSQVADADTDKIIEAVKKANVLFLVESTAAMSFSPKGVMPIVVLDPSWRYGVVDAANWEATKNIYGYGFHDVQRLMEQSTFGMGALPTAWSGLSVRNERNLYGRDIDARNNYVKTGKSRSEDLDANKDRYYFPFDNPSRADALREAYGAQTHPLETHFTGSVRPKNSAKDSSLPYAALQENTNAFMGTSKTANYAYNKLPKSGALPYALVFKNPKYWEKGWTESRAPTADDLVPNDSRMYQAKLALWRLLEDGSLFSGIRLGLATTFLSPVNTSNKYPGQQTWNNPHYGANDRTDFNTIFRVEPFGSNIYTQRYFDSANGYAPSKYLDFSINTSAKDGRVPPPADSGSRYQTLQYKNGVLLMNITGHPAGWEAMHGTMFPVWSNSQVATNYSMDNDIYGQREGWTPTERILFRLENRASLHVPIADFDYVWSKTHKYKTKEISHADKIRLWINGLADIRSPGAYNAAPYASPTDGRSFSSNTDKDDRNSQFHFFKDPEIGVSGTFALPNAIFPDPNPDYEMSREKTVELGSRTVWYSDATSNTNYIGYIRTDNFRKLANPKAFFNAGSGEAAGSVLDFFSPYIHFDMKKEDMIRSGYVANSKAIDRANLIDLSYPIRNACEDNWLVVIASGMEVEPVDQKSYRYNSWDAIKNLYDYTDRKNPKRGKVTKMSYKWDAKQDRRVRAYEAIDLDRPIRTLVVGIAADPEDPEIAKDPLLKAQAGRMRENLNRMARAGQGIDPNDKNSDVTAYFADDVPSLIEAIREAMLFINDFPTDKPGKGSIPTSPSIGGDKDSMSLYSYSYRAMHTNQWAGSLTRYEAVRGADGGLTLSKAWELGQNIASKRGRRNLRYWSGSLGAFVALSPGDSNFKRLTGLDASKMIGGKIQLGALKSYPPHTALYRWLQGYDHSYAKGGDFERSSMLADIGQSGIVYVDDPASVDSLPGYEKWAAGASAFGKSQPPRLYIQTNDGILHIVDPSNGDERAAILPPPVLVPSRLATLKTRLFENRLEWIDVTAPEGSGKLRSSPAYTLDGPLIKKNIDMSGSGVGWGSYILGTLGRGGGGLYMLDVTSRDKPKFLWYRERLDGGRLATMESGKNEPEVRDLGDLDASLLAYMKLGFNSPKPAIGVTGSLGAVPELRNFIALPGGVQTEVDLGQNGGEGAALLFIDAGSGRVIRAFDSASLAGVDKKWRTGAGVSGKAPHMGMIVSEPVLFRSDNSPYLTGRVFASDNRGNIFCVYMEGKDAHGGTGALPPDRWHIRTLATLQKSVASAGSDVSSYSIPHGLTLGTVNSDNWAAGGTTDVSARMTAAFPEGVIKNESQMIFGIKLREDGAVFARDEMKLIAAGDGKDALGAGESYKGWYIPLRKEGQNVFAEYVSSKPVLINGTLFVSTFIQKGKMDIGADPDKIDVCAYKQNVNGDSRLYALDVTTGGASFWTSQTGKAKYITLSGVKVSGLTYTKGKSTNSLLVSFEDLSGGFKPEALGRKNVSGVAGADNMIEVKGIPEPMGSLPLGSGNSVIDYWLIKR